MRPRGEYRQALEYALRGGGGQWHPVGATSRELAARANLGVDVARLTLDNMVRADAAVKLDDTVRVPGVKRPVPVYAAADARAADLSRAVGAWWRVSATPEPEELAA